MAKAAEETDLSVLKRKFQESQSVTEEARRESLTDRDYYDGYQWSATEKEALAERKQPDTVFNRVRVAVNGILGVATQGKTDPRAYPRNPQDEESADVASKALRFIADKSEFGSVKNEAFENFLIEGTCAAIVEVDEELNIWPRQIRWEEYFHDPYARRKDLADKNYDGAARWMFADDLVERYPEKRADIEGFFGASGLDFSQSSQDRPDGGFSTWCDKKKNRLLVVEMYHKDGGWKRSEFFGGGVLASGPSPYLDDKGRPCNPIESRSAYVDRQNRRMGAVRDMRGPQDEINKRRSKLLHLLNVSQIQAVDPSAVEVNADDARREAARPDGVIPFGWQKVSTADVASGQAQLLAEAKDEIERLGANPAVLGRQSQDASGRAQMVRQQAGMTELATLFDGMGEWELAIYRQMWMRARQFWKAEKFIRVTDDVKAPEFIGLNQPVWEERPRVDPMTGQPAMDEKGQPVMEPVQAPMINPQTGQIELSRVPKVDPQTGRQAVKNDIGQLGVDIILDKVPDTANLQQEQFLALVEMAKAGVQIPPPILLEASSLHNKRELIEKMGAATQQPDPMREVAQAAAVADIKKTESETALNTAKAESEQAGTMMDAMRAGHDLTQPAAGDYSGVSAA